MGLESKLPEQILFAVYRTHVAEGVREEHDRGLQEGAISCPWVAVGMGPKGEVKSWLAGLM
jgi:hypothetical protein